MTKDYHKQSAVSFLLKRCHWTHHNHYFERGEDGLSFSNMWCLIGCGVTTSSCNHHLFVTTKAQIQPLGHLRLDVWFIQNGEGCKLAHPGDNFTWQNIVRLMKMTDFVMWISWGLFMTYSSIAHFLQIHYTNNPK
jgi:hypothetical protein